MICVLITFIQNGISTILYKDSHIVRIYEWKEKDTCIIKERVGNWLMDPSGKKDLIDLDNEKQVARLKK